MSTKRKLRKLQLQQIARDRMADPDASALDQVHGWRMIVKAIRNRRARKPQR